MNVNAFLQKDYENETAFRPKKTNPIKANFKRGVHATLRSINATKHELMDSRNYKKYLTLSLRADRICCVPEIICCNRNNEKGFQTCL